MPVDKRTAILIDKEEHIVQVQKKLFKKGYRWGNYYPLDILDDAKHSRTIYFNRDFSFENRITWSAREERNDNGYEIINSSNFLNPVKQLELF